MKVFLISMGILFVICAVRIIKAYRRERLAIDIVWRYIFYKGLGLELSEIQRQIFKHYNLTPPFSIKQITDFEAEQEYELKMNPLNLDLWVIQWAVTPIAEKQGLISKSDWKDLLDGQSRRIRKASKQSRLMVERVGFRFTLNNLQIERITFQDFAKRIAENPRMKSKGFEVQ